MIENDLKRIADALEGILGVITKVGPAVAKVEPTVSTPVAPSVPVAETVVPKKGITSSAQAPQAWPNTSEELRTLAQKIAQKMGPKTLEFTEWVKALLAPYGVQTILAVPQDKIIEVAVKLDGYAREKGINV
jgi:hypothetical protein